MADQLHDRIAKSIETLLVKPGSSVVLATDFDPAFKTRVKKKKQGVKRLAEGVELLTEYQARLAPRTPMGCSSCCRHWTRRARTARSVT